MKKNILCTIFIFLMTLTISEFFCTNVFAEKTETPTILDHENKNLKDISQLTIYNFSLYQKINLTNNQFDYTTNLDNRKIGVYNIEYQATVSSNNTTTVTKNIKVIYHPISKLTLDYKKQLHYAPSTLNFKITTYGNKYLCDPNIEYYIFLNNILALKTTETEFDLSFYEYGSNNVTVLIKEQTNSGEIKNTSTNANIIIIEDYWWNSTLIITILVVSITLISIHRFITHKKTLGGNYGQNKKYRNPTRKN